MKFPEDGPKQEYSPEQKIRIKYLLEIADKDLTSPFIVGYHGTSLSSMKLIIETGKLFGSPIEGEEHGFPEKGSLYFYPKASTFPSDFDADGLRILKTKQDEENIRGAASYAESLSETDIFYEFLGLDRTNTDHALLHAPFGIIDGTSDDIVMGTYGGNAYYKDLSEIVEQLQIPEKKLRAALEAVEEGGKSRKGFIIGLDKKLLERYTPRNGDDMDGEDYNDLCIQCPEGLDYSLLSGLRALGQKEQEFLATLRTKI